MTDTAEAVTPSSGAGVDTSPAPAQDVSSVSPAPVDAPVTQPVVETPAPAETAAPAVEPKVETPASTLISEAVEPAAEPAVEAPAEEVKADPQTEAPVEVPKFDDFKLPEGFNTEDATFKNFLEDLGKFENSTKVDHAALQEFGQGMVAKYAESVQNAIQDFAKHQDQQWSDVKKSWNETLQKDPELGGEHVGRTKANINRVIGKFGGTQEEIASFQKFMDETGLGNHPTLVRYFSRMGAFLSEGRMVPATKPVPSAPLSRVEKFYGSK